MTIHRIRICKCGHEESLHGFHGCSYGLGQGHGKCDCERFRSRKVLGKKRAPVQAKLPATSLAAMKVAMEFMVLAIALEEKRKEAVDEHRKQVTIRALAHPDDKPEKKKRPDDSPNAVERTYKAALARGPVAIMTAVAQHQNGVTREQLSILTGYRRSTRDTYIQRLRIQGFVEEESGTILATVRGVRSLGDGFQPLPTGRALREHWTAKLPKGERMIFEYVVSDYPKAVSREDLSTATGFKRSTRDTYIQRLIARKLVTGGHGTVMASKELF